jgi:hypothetical protein
MLSVLCIENQHQIHPEEFLLHKKHLSLLLHPVICSQVLKRKKKACTVIPIILILFIDSSRSGFEKREKRRQIRKLQDAITEKDVSCVKEILQDEFDVDFQYRGQTALQQAVRDIMMRSDPSTIMKYLQQNIKKYCNQLYYDSFHK